MLILNDSAAVDVTADANRLAAQATPPRPDVGCMLIVQNEVMGAFPTLEPYRIANPDPLPQDPGPNGLFVQAPTEAWLQAAAPANAENPWSLWIEV